MSRTIAVIYEHGVLKPLESLDYPEQSRLEIEIISQGAEERDNELSDAERAYNALLEAGLISSAPKDYKVKRPPAESEVLRVADELGKHGPLSEVIIQEREES